METESKLNASVRSDKSSSEPESAEIEPTTTDKNEQPSFSTAAVEQPGIEEGTLELEILKNIVRTITSSLNRTASIPQKAVAVFGTTTEEKIENLAAEACKSFQEAQELPPRAAKMLQKAEEEGKKGYELKDCFQTIALMTLSNNTESNRRLASANRGETEELQQKTHNEIIPRVKTLIFQVINSYAFKSDQMCNFAAQMEPSNVDYMAEEALAALEADVQWILQQLWGKTAANLWRQMLAECEKRQEINSRAGQRITILSHLWNLRFKAILRRPVEQRHLHNALERELCKAVSEALYGQLLQILRNTRCIQSELVINAARSAKSNMDALFSPINPISTTLGKLLANADSNPEFSNWDAILIIRSLWPQRNQMSSSEYAILNLSGIDNRIESALENPESLRGTSYEKFFIKRSYASEGMARKRRRTEQEGWNEDLAADSSRYEGSNGSW